MAASILDGTRIAQAIRAEVAPAVEAFTKAAGRRPGLGIVLVGDDPASQVYVGSKVKTGAESGLHVELTRLSASSSLTTVLDRVRALNQDETVDGILVQSPLPKALGPEAARMVFDAIDPAKDVDGFTAENVGRLVQNRPGLVPCTPAGIMELLTRCEIPVAGRHAVVIGRSDIVGKPMALLLLHRDATVTVCHSRTPDLAAVCRSADIVVAAVGRAGLVTKAFVRPGATVIDVGMNRVCDRLEAAALFAGHPRMAVFERNGSILVGDVHPEVAEVAGALTPVPGGVGPLTIAMLLANTLKAAQRRAQPAALEQA